MDWSKATPSLVESGIGLALLILAAVVYIVGHRSGTDVDSEDTAPGCVWLILAIVGGIALWHGMDAFDAIATKTK
jgi:hypothetical protein